MAGIEVSAAERPQQRFQEFGVVFPASSVVGLGSLLVLHTAAFALGGTPFAGPLKFWSSIVVRVGLDWGFLWVMFKVGRLRHVQLGVMAVALTSVGVVVGSLLQYELLYGRHGLSFTGAAKLLEWLQIVPNLAIAAGLIGLGLSLFSIGAAPSTSASDADEMSKLSN